MLRSSIKPVQEASIDHHLSDRNVFSNYVLWAARAGYISTQVFHKPCIILAISYLLAIKAITMGVQEVASIVQDNVLEGRAAPCEHQAEAMY